MSKILRLIAFVGLVGFSLSLGACGVKGPLELPPEEKLAKQSGGTDKNNGHKPFVLDGLIR